MYIGHLILCLREWWRILRDDGVCFVNLGDSYNGSGGYSPNSPANQNGSLQSQGNIKGERNRVGRNNIAGLKPKDLCMVPARFALAAQADGWYLRSDIIWHKPNPMPESVTDRCTKAHEYIYMLAKSESYYFDADAIREPHTDLQSVIRHKDAGRGTQGYAIASGLNDHPQRNSNNGLGGHPAGRNKRSVWTVSTRPYPGSHFACFPPEIPELCIRAGSSQHGVCAKCGSPWRRVVERTDMPDPSAKGSRFDKGKTAVNGNGRVQGGERHLKIDTGWHPTCNCNCDEVIPATVLDPFVGSGTTLRVAMKLGRSAIGVDISDQYLTDLVPERTSNVQMELTL